MRLNVLDKHFFLKAKVISKKLTKGKRNTIKWIWTVLDLDSTNMGPKNLYIRVYSIFGLIPAFCTLSHSKLSTEPTKIGQIRKKN